MTMRTWMVLALGCLSATAVAQDATSGNIKYREVTVLDIENDLEISAELLKPSGILVHSTPRGNFNPLIELRTNFDKEMVRSVDDVK